MNFENKGGSTSAIELPLVVTHFTYTLKDIIETV